MRDSERDREKAPVLAVPVPCAGCSERGETTAAEFVCTSCKLEPNVSEAEVSGGEGREREREGEGERERGREREGGKEKVAGVLL